MKAVGSLGTQGTVDGPNGIVQLTIEIGIDGLAVGDEVELNAATLVYPTGGQGSEHIQIQAAHQLHQLVLIVEGVILRPRPYIAAGGEISGGGKFKAAVHTAVQLLVHGRQRDAVAAHTPADTHQGIRHRGAALAGTPEPVLSIAQIVEQFIHLGIVAAGEEGQPLIAKGGRLVAAAVVVVCHALKCALAVDGVHKFLHSGHVEVIGVVGLKVQLLVQPAEHQQSVGPHVIGEQQDKQNG